MSVGGVEVVQYAIARQRGGATHGVARWARARVVPRSWDERSRNKRQWMKKIREYGEGGKK
jgi:hypothetical protein